MKNKLTLFILIIILSPFALNAQNVGIGTNTPDASAMLDVESTTGGILIPRVNSMERDDITNPAIGLLVFNSQTNQFEFYNGTSWTTIAASGSTDKIIDADQDTYIQVFENGTLDYVAANIEGTEVFRFLKNNSGIVRFELKDNVANNLLIGDQAGKSLNATATWNTFIGKEAGENQTGDFNVIIGGLAGNENSGGSENTMLGTRAGRYSAGSKNVYIGRDAGIKDNGTENTLVGYGSGANPTTTGITGNSNTFIGFESGQNTDSGQNNTFLGHQAGKNNEGNRNVILGKSAGENSNETDLVLMGYEAGKTTTGNKNVMIGSWSGTSNTDGINNTFVGDQSGYNNDTGNANVFIGGDAGHQNVAGGSNTQIGSTAGRQNEDGNNNTNIGFSAGYSNVNGNNNTNVGIRAQLNNQSGSNNVTIGREAGYTNTSGTGNIFLGNQAGYNELGNDKLYIDNSDTDTPLIYGDFNTNQVFINKNAASSSTEVFGIRKNVTGPAYGGMQIETSGNADSKAYLSFAADELSHSWLYLDGLTDELKFYHYADRFAILPDGRIRFNNSYTFPSSSGISGQVLQTDGAGNLTWEDDESLGIFEENAGVIRQKTGYDDNFIVGRDALPINGANVSNNFFFFDDAKGAFRGGKLFVSKNWSPDSIGSNSFGYGYNIKAKGNYSTTLGSETNATGNYSTAIGRATEAIGESSTSIGLFTKATGKYSTAIGNNADASGENSTAMGFLTNATGESSISIGRDTDAFGDYSTAIGNSTDAIGTRSTALGYYSKSIGPSSTAMGYRTTALSLAETVIGRYNSNYTPIDTFGWNSNDRLFVIGNGSSYVNGSDAMVVLKNGDTGIGSSSPSEKLHIKGEINIEAETNDAVLNMQSINTTKNRVIVMQDNGDDIFFGDLDGHNRDVYFRSAGNDVMIIDNAGNVGIGEFTPAQKLEVEGNIFADGDIYTRSSNGVINVGGGYMNAQINMISDNGTFPSHVNGDEDLYIEDDLELGSQGYKPGGGSWASVSDKRLKKEIKDFTDGLDVLMDIRPVSYKYNDKIEIYEGDKEFIGVLAQEVQQVAPYMVEEKALFQKVIEDENGRESITDPGENYLTYDASALNYILVNAVQEQQQMILELKNELDALKKELKKDKKTHVSKE